MIKKINKRTSAVLYQKAIQCVPLVESGLTSVLEKKTVWLPEVHELIQDLKDTAENIANQCLGLAANQIWDKDMQCPAVFIMRWPNDTDSRGWGWKAIINPQIKLTGKTLKLEEACLSFPGRHKKKSRGKNVTMLFQTETNIKMQVIKFLQNHGNWGHIVQHEYDHLLGTPVFK
jgi:peptide deformylase